MKFTINRENLLKPLQMVSGAVERRHTLPILANVLLEVKNGTLALIGTDLEVELVSSYILEGDIEEGSVTVPAKKLLDICRGLSEGAEIKLAQDGEKVIVRSGRSRYTLSSLPASDFPNLEDWQGEVQFTIAQTALKELIDSTHFAMANQDVRYYLNGMLFETDENILRSVATDGHRLALCTKTLDDVNLANKQVIVPRKGVLEIQRLLEDEGQVTIQIGTNHIRLQGVTFTMTSKLVDGRFPDYRRVLPKDGDKFVKAPREVLKNAFSRAAILSNEKFRGVRINLSMNELKITATNPEQEEAEEIVDIDYNAGDLEIGFNVSYLLDVFNTIESEEVTISLVDNNSSALISDDSDTNALYVVMPMRL
jgi:DNA polymerase-3 subunit beta